MCAQLWTMVDPRDRNRKCLFGRFDKLVRISDLVQGTIHDRQGSTSQKKKISPDFGPSCPHHILAWPQPLPLIRRGNVRRHHGRVLHHLCDSKKEVWATDPRSPTCRFRGPEISRCGFVMTSARMRFCIDKTALRKCHFDKTEFEPGGGRQTTLQARRQHTWTQRTLIREHQPLKADAATTLKLLPASAISPSKSRGFDDSASGRRSRSGSITPPRSGLYGLNPNTTTIHSTHNIKIVADFTRRTKECVVTSLASSSTVEAAGEEGLLPGLQALEP